MSLQMDNYYDLNWRDDLKRVDVVGDGLCLFRSSYASEHKKKTDFAVPKSEYRLSRRQTTIKVIELAEMGNAEAQLRINDFAVVNPLRRPEDNYRDIMFLNEELRGDTGNWGASAEVQAIADLRGRNIITRMFFKDEKHTNPIPQYMRYYSSNKEVADQNEPIYLDYDPSKKHYIGYYRDPEKAYKFQRLPHRNISISGINKKIQALKEKPAVRNQSNVKKSQAMPKQETSKQRLPVEMSRGNLAKSNGRERGKENILDNDPPSTSHDALPKDKPKDTTTNRAYKDEKKDPSKAADPPKKKQKRKKRKIIEVSYKNQCGIDVSSTMAWPKGLISIPIKKNGFSLYSAFDVCEYKRTVDKLKSEKGIWEMRKGVASIVHNTAKSGEESSNKKMNDFIHCNPAIEPIHHYLPAMNSRKDFENIKLNYGSNVEIQVLADTRSRNILLQDNSPTGPSLMYFKSRNHSTADAKELIYLSRDDENNYAAYYFPDNTDPSYQGYKLPEMASPMFNSSESSPGLPCEISLGNSDSHADGSTFVGDSGKAIQNGGGIKDKACSSSLNEKIEEKKTNIDPKLDQRLKRAKKREFENVEGERLSDEYDIQRDKQLTKRVKKRREIKGVSSNLTQEAKGLNIGGNNSGTTNLNQELATSDLELDEYDSDLDPIWPSDEEDFDTIQDLVDAGYNSQEEMDVIESIQSNDESLLNEVKESDNLDPTSSLNINFSVNEQESRKFSHEKLRIIALNINGLRRYKREWLKSISNQCDVLLINESWERVPGVDYLTNSYFRYLLHLEENQKAHKNYYTNNFLTSSDVQTFLGDGWVGYNQSLCPTEENLRKGVAIYVRKNIKSSPIPGNPLKNCTDSVGRILGVHLEDYGLNIWSIYFPTSALIAEKKEYVDTIKKNILKSPNNIIAGDWNMDPAAYRHKTIIRYAGEEFEDKGYQFWDVKQCPNGPPLGTHEKGGFLDHFLMNSDMAKESNASVKFLPFHKGMSDHRGVKLTLWGNEKEDFFDPDEIQDTMRMEWLMKRRTCWVCGHESNSPNNLLEHMIIHIGHKPFGCDTCNKRFAHNTTLTRHQIVHSGEKKYDCSECSRSFAHKAYLDRHQLTHTGERNFACPDCPRAFARKGNLKTHQLTHVKYDRMRCLECLIVFDRKEDLAAHMPIHADIKPFICPTQECSRAFKSEACLNRHIVEHTGKVPFVCPLCSHEFKIKSKLEKHLTIHKNEKNFKCPVCSLAFNTNGNLTNHMGIHSTIKFICPECSQKFNMKQNLKRHLKRMHNY